MKGRMFEKFMETLKGDRTRRVLKDYQKESEEMKALVAEGTALITRYAVQFGDLTGLGGEYQTEANEMANLLVRLVGSTARMIGTFDEVMVIQLENAERVERLEHDLERYHDEEIDNLNLIRDGLDDLRMLRKEKEKDK